MKMLFQIHIAEQGYDAREKVYPALADLYYSLLEPQPQPISWNPDERSTAVHLTAGDSFAGSLKLALKQMGRNGEQRVISFRDLYAVGPLWRLHEQQGQRYRQDWLRDHLQNGDEMEIEEEYHELQLLLDLIPPQAAVIIWTGNNAHEQIMLRLAVYLLRHKPNTLLVRHAVAESRGLHDALGTREDYAGLHSGELSAEKLRQVLEQPGAQAPVTRAVRNQLEQEWLSLADQDSVLRIWQEEAICSVSADYFDVYLLETVDKLHEHWGGREFMKAARVIGEALGNCDQHMRDEYFEYRLRELVYSGVLEIRGVPKAMRSYCVRRRQPDPPRP
ncbi:DUF1835 domain-containing protein [Paenibacillus sp. y28]